MRRGTCFAFIMAKSFKTLLRVATRLQLICCVFACLCAFTAGNCSIAETGYDAWLRYPPVPESVTRELYRELPETIVTLNTCPIVESAKDELIRGFRGMLASELKPITELGTRPAIILATISAHDQLLKDAKISKDDASLRPEEFHIQIKSIGGKRNILILAGDERGLLYGTFSFLRHIALHKPVDQLDIRERPYAPIRILNHWDNLDGTIERGYAGKSIFWDGGHVVRDTSRLSDYARLMASVGINGCSINNVNADARVVSPSFLPEVARIADAFRLWGVRVYISVNFASPREIGGVKTFDPLDPAAVAFWRKTVDETYRTIPNLGGFVLKADSEGRLGPSEYGRTHADAANAIARALKPHGGILFYRGFVYNNKMDWRELKNDRAKAAYDNFHKLDGLFEDNVVIQIKHGPIDFQVREPASPLFGGLEKTNQAVELQITQEYLGQQRHVCFTVPMWKEVLDFNMHAKGEGTPVKQLVSGKTFNRPTGGFVGVANVGRDTNWLGHHLAMANLFGFGRLAWNPDLSSEQIADEWTRLTFGDVPLVVQTVKDILLRSWPVYESYTGPLGIGTLTDIIHIHFGPAPESSEYNGWGQWHRANATGVGMDRTVATGTGFIGQYRRPVATTFESLATCPDDLLLFMHHVPYSHKLHSGKTVIQHFYDAHYDGAERAAGFLDQWTKLQPFVDEQRFREVRERLEFQAGHAQVWRDAICRWFMKRSGIADQKGRVRNNPNRFEAEDMKLTGYRKTLIEPWEAASGTGAVQLPDNVDEGSVQYRYEGPPGKYEVRIQYFDEQDGVSSFDLFVNGLKLDEWKADDELPTPTTRPDAHSSTRHTVRNVSLQSGDEIRIEGRADAGERAAIDYLEIVPIAGEKR
jgi:alpha-glucuronidase